MYIIIILTRACSQRHDYTSKGFALKCFIRMDTKFSYHPAHELIMLFHSLLLCKSCIYIYYVCFLHRLSLLQLRDQEKRENELAKNNLESHIFEFTDFMYTDEAATYSSEEERETITENLRTTSEWLEEDGYDEETSVYKQKLKDLKRLSRPVVRRKQEASKRPELFQRLRNSINVSVEFLGRMKNISELEIFTDVEAKTLADASIAAQVGNRLCV